VDPTTEEIAKAVACGHGFKHVEEKEFSGGKPQYGPDTNVRTQDDYEAHVLGVLRARGTKGFESGEGHFHFYHKESNTYVFYDKMDRYEATCFRPKGKKRDYFDRLWNKDCRDRQEWFRGRVSEKGGYPALLEKLGRQLPERSAESPRKKNVFELASERALAAKTVEREPGKERKRDSENER